MFLVGSFSSNLYSILSRDVTGVIPSHFCPLIIKITPGQVFIVIISSLLSYSVIIIFPFSILAPNSSLVSGNSSIISFSSMLLLFSSTSIISISTFFLKNFFSSLIILYFKASFERFNSEDAFSRHSFKDDPEKLQVHKYLPLKYSFI